MSYPYLLPFISVASSHSDKPPNLSLSDGFLHPILSFKLIILQAISSTFGLADQLLSSLPPTQLIVTYVSRAVSSQPQPVTEPLKFRKHLLGKVVHVPSIRPTSTFKVARITLKPIRAVPVFLLLLALLHQALQLLVNQKPTLSALWR